MNLSRRFGIRGAAILALLLFVFPLAVAAADLPAPSTDFYVADYAGVLSEETESEIVVENDALYRETGAQIVIVTMETLDGADIADFTYDLFAEWGIGSAEKNNGFLLVLAIEEDDYYALQGVGLSERLSDSTISDMLNEYLEPDFAAKNYDAGVQTLFQAVLSRVKAIEADRVDSGVKENFSRIADAAASRRESASGFVATIGNFFKKGILLIFLVVVLLLVIILSIFRRPRWRYMGGAGWGGRFYGGRFGRRRRPPPPPPMGGFGFGPPPGRPGGFGGGRPSRGSGVGRASSAGRRGGGGRSAGGGAGRRR